MPKPPRFSDEQVLAALGSAELTIRQLTERLYGPACRASNIEVVRQRVKRLEAQEKVVTEKKNRVVCIRKVGVVIPMSPEPSPKPPPKRMKAPRPKAPEPPKTEIPLGKTLGEVNPDRKKYLQEQETEIRGQILALEVEMAKARASLEVVLKMQRGMTL